MIRQNHLKMLTFESLCCFFKLRRSDLRQEKIILSCWRQCPHCIDPRLWRRFYLFVLFFFCKSHWTFSLSTQLNLSFFFFTEEWSYHRLCPYGLYLVWSRYEVSNEPVLSRRSALWVRSQSTLPVRTPRNSHQSCNQAISKDGTLCQVSKTPLLCPCIIKVLSFSD